MFKNWTCDIRVLVLKLANTQCNLIHEVNFGTRVQSPVLHVRTQGCAKCSGKWKDHKSQISQLLLTLVPRYPAFWFCQQIDISNTRVTPGNGSPLPVHLRET